MSTRPVRLSAASIRELANAIAGAISRDERVGESAPGGDSSGGASGGGGAGSPGGGGGGPSSAEKTAAKAVSDRRRTIGAAAAFAGSQIGGTIKGGLGAAAGAASIATGASFGAGSFGAGSANARRAGEATTSVLGLAGAGFAVGGPVGALAGATAGGISSAFSQWNELESVDAQKKLAIDETKTDFENQIAIGAINAQEKGDIAFATFARQKRKAQATTGRAAEQTRSIVSAGRLGAEDLTEANVGAIFGALEGLNQRDYGAQQRTSQILNKMMRGTRDGSGLGGN